MSIEGSFNIQVVRFLRWHGLYEKFLKCYNPRDDLEFTEAEITFIMDRFKSITELVQEAMNNRWSKEK